MTSMTSNCDHGDDGVPTNSASTAADGLSVLCERLRGERLLVASEIETLQCLNKHIDTELCELVHLAWSSRQEQLLLSRLINSHPDATPDNSCHILARLEGARFINGHQRLGHHDATMSQLLTMLRDNPNVLADLMNMNDTYRVDGLELPHTVFSLVYCCCVFPKDERLALETLLCLLRIQLSSSSNPRKILRKGTCAFSRFYRLFSESLYTAKVFLTAALHDPVMSLLSHDDFFLDIDPSKAVIRFPLDERIRRFGSDEHSPTYAANVEKYRNVVASKLVSIGMKFIEGICQAMPCFPTSLIWLVRQLYDVLTSSNRVSKDEASLICSDLIFTYFLCPAITNPEPLGIVADTPISYVARFNLMQIGQMLQTLAVWPYERTSDNLFAFYSQFDHQSVSNILKIVLETNLGSLENIFPSLSTSDGVELLERRAFVGTIEELSDFHNFLNHANLDMISDPNARQELRLILKRLPINLCTKKDDKIVSTPQQSNIHGGNGAGNSSRRLRTLAGKVHSASSKRLMHATTIDSERNHHHRSDDALQVLMIPLGETRPLLGLDMEEKFMESLRPSRQQKSSNGGEKRARFVDSESIATSDRTEGGSEEGSLSSSLDGMTNNDNEDISTLPDNFSDVVPISANVSGRGSPSISGRETPLSVHAEQQQEGEEVEANEDAPSSVNGAQGQQHRNSIPGLPVTVRKENTDGLEEKFGKFVLPPDQNPRYRDDTHSMVSDSWSTDVVPSDNEGASEPPTMLAPGGIVPAGSLPDVIPGTAADLPRLDLIREQANAAVNRGAIGGNASGAVGGASANNPVPTAASLALIEDRSDTWSVDAIASDSEADTANRNEDMLMIDDAISDSGAIEDPTMDNRQAGSGAHSDSIGEAQAIATRSLSTPAASSVDVRTIAPLLPSTPRLQSVSRSLVPPSSSSDMLPTDKERLRRQSSGSSFYSKSDVDSEFSKDFGEDVTSTYLYESSIIMPQFRSNAVEFHKNTTPQRVDVAIGNAHQLVDDNTPPPEPVSIVATLTTDTTSVQPNGNPPSSNTSNSSGEDAKRASSHQWRTPNNNNATIKPSTNSRRVPSTVSGSSRKIFQGLQKMSETFKNRRSLSNTFRPSHSRTMDDLTARGSTTTGVSSRPLNECDNSHSVDELVMVNEQSADDILKKYSNKTKLDATTTLITVNHEQQQSTATTKSTDAVDSTSIYYDPDNLTQCRAFLDAKRKLRLVLSSVGSLPVGCNNASHELRVVQMMGRNSTLIVQDIRKNIKDTKENDDLIQFLRLLLAESINGQQKSLSAQIREVLRCLAVFDARGIRKLLRTLKDDHRKRTSYLLYLQQSRLTLLQLRSYLEKLTSRIQREQSLTGECMIEMLVRFYLESNDRQLRQFIDEFRSLVMRDEKTDLVERFLASLYRRMPDESPWRSANDDRLAYARKSLERSVMAQVHTVALYPNGEADIYRDEVLFESINRLASVIGVNHPSLGIPRSLHGECPWPSAQAEISIINAYKSPRDKLSCIVRCCETIENLVGLSSASNRAAAADDITPILVFVIIQANPPGLLSNLQYIEGFCGNTMHGADEYWWTQFASAVEFIKSLLNVEQP